MSVWRFLTGFVEVAVLFLSPFDLGDLSGSLATLGLSPEPPLSELLVVDAEFLFRPSLGDLGRVVGICKIDKFL